MITFYIGAVVGFIVGWIACALVTLDKVRGNK